MENPFDFSKEKVANTVKRIWLVNKNLGNTERNIWQAEKKYKKV